MTEQRREPNPVQNENTKGGQPMTPNHSKDKRAHGDGVPGQPPANPPPNARTSTPRNTGKGPNDPIDPGLKDPKDRQDQRQGQDPVPARQGRVAPNDNRNKDGTPTGAAADPNAAVQYPGPGEVNKDRHRDGTRPTADSDG